MTTEQIIEEFSKRGRTITEEQAKNPEYLLLLLPSEMGDYELTMGLWYGMDDIRRFGIAYDSKPSKNNPYGERLFVASACKSEPIIVDAATRMYMLIWDSVTWRVYLAPEERWQAAYDSVAKAVAEAEKLK